VAHDSEILVGIFGAHATVILAEGNIQPPMQPILNGLITNDKFCLSRIVHLLSFE
jgi:hypothetical protein